MPDSFVVAVASGKGGTGKTTIAANLARIICESAPKVQYLDCDVEEPNGHIFLRPEITARQKVTVNVPQVDFQACTAQKWNLKSVGDIPYDPAVTKAQIAGKSIIEYSNGSLRSSLISLWQAVLDILEESEKNRS